jgi:predicted dienelactone hydrolase
VGLRAVGGAGARIQTGAGDIAGNTIAYDVIGQGPLVVLAHGIGDSRHSYRFLAPALAAAGYRVANMDIHGCSVPAEAGTLQSNRHRRGT